MADGRRLARENRKTFARINATNLSCSPTCWAKGMLVDAMNHRFPEAATPSTVIGPFHIDDSPELPMGANVAEGLASEPYYLVRTVRDLSGKPVEGAQLDIWQADADGLYESQLGSEEPVLRAIFQHRGRRQLCDLHGSRRRAIPFPWTCIGGDPAAKNGRISHFRPAHIHFFISAPG